MPNFPGDPYGEKVDPFPCWVALPKQAMQTVWMELHRTEKSRANMIEKLRKIDNKAWMAICREKVCVGIDLKLWMPIIRGLALDCSDEEIKDMCPLPILDDEDDCIEMAKKVLKDAVRGNLEIDDNERVKAANMILRMKVTKISDNIINVDTGVPRHEKNTNNTSSASVLQQYTGVGGIGDDGAAGSKGVSEIARSGEAGRGEEDFSQS